MQMKDIVYIDIFILQLDYTYIIDMSFYVFGWVIQIVSPLFLSLTMLPNPNQFYTWGS